MELSGNFVDDIIENSERVKELEEENKRLKETNSELLDVLRRIINSNGSEWNSWQAGKRIVIEKEVTPQRE